MFVGKSMDSLAALFQTDVEAALRLSIDMAAAGSLPDDGLDAVLTAVRRGRADATEDYLRPVTFARILRLAASGTHRTKIVSELLDAVGQGASGAATLLGECALTTFDGSTVWESKLSTDSNPFVEPLLSQAPRLRSIIDQRLTSAGEPELNSLLGALLRLPLEAEEQRVSWRLCEQALRRRPELLWPVGYEPAAHADPDAMAPLAEIACAAAMASRPEELARCNGSIASLPGVTICDRATMELSNYGDSHRVEVIEAWSGPDWTDDAIFVLASAHLSQAVYRPEAATLFAALFEALHRLPMETTRGQAQLRKALVQLKVIDKAALPKSERASIPRNLPATTKAAKSLATKLDLTKLFAEGKASKSEIEGARLPPALAELYQIANGISALRVRPLTQLDTLRGEFLRELAGHREEDGDPTRLLRIEHAEGALSLDPDTCVPFATDTNGDTFALATALMSDKDQPVVIRFVHDECLTARLEAASAGEWLGRQVIRLWTKQQMLGDKATTLLNTPVRLAK